MRILIPLSILAVFVRAQHEPQQIAFGLSGATITRHTTETLNVNGVEAARETEAFKQSSNTTSACSILEASRSLLHTITSQAPPSLATSSSSNTFSIFNPSSYEPYLDLIERSLGPFAGSVIRYIRKGVNYIYAGKGRDKKEGQDWSIRGVVRKIMSLSEFRIPYWDQEKKGATKQEGWWNKGTPSRKLGREEVAEGMEQVLRLAEEAAQKGCHEAWVMIGDLHMTGHLTLKPNATRAREAYTNASEKGGIPEAQYKLGFMYGSNWEGVFGGSKGIGKQGSALLHYTFAALSLHVPASMTVGYRHWVGIGTKQSCQEARGWYKAAADDAMRTFNAGPPGGRLLPPPKLRLSDLDGGVYGPGASASHTPHVTGGSNSQTQQEWEDLLEYHHFHAERGDVAYMFRLGRLYYQGFGGGGLGGSRGAPSRLNVGNVPFVDTYGMTSEGGRNFVRASQWFMRVARGVWPKDLKEVLLNPAPTMGEVQQKGGFYDAAKDVKIKTDDHYLMVAGLSAGFLGRMYLRGEGVRVDYAKAFLWFMRGSAQGDRESNNGLGILFRDGLGVERDLPKANLLFLAAAQQDLADAQVNLGKYYFGIGDYPTAATYFDHAVRQDPNRSPDTFQAYYYLAELTSIQLNRPEQCPSAVSFYKMVAERGDWEHEVWWEAERAYKNGEMRTAILGYWLMAERGYEVAQNNLAFLLDPDKQRLKLNAIDSQSRENETERIALTYWTRSAAQENVDALVKMGDYYYNGIGVPAPQYAKAASCYQSAVNSRISAMAMWNLGWMHENGKGVSQDYHLAKRYYDMALETSRDAYFPSTLSLYFLRSRSIYHSLFGTDTSLKSLSLFSSPPVDDRIIAQPQGWTIRRMWRAVQRQWGYDPGPEPMLVVAPPQVVNPPAVGGAGGAAGAGDAGRTAAHAQAQRAALEANDDLDWGGRGGGIGDEEEEDFYQMEGEGDLTGTVAIVALCVILGYLFYFRQNRIPVERPPRRRAGVQRPPPVVGGADVPDEGAQEGAAGGVENPGDGAEQRVAEGEVANREEVPALLQMPEDTSDEDMEGEEEGGGRLG